MVLYLQRLVFRYYNINLFTIVSVLRVLISSGVIWTLYDWLNKFYSCYMVIVVGIVYGCGLGIDTHHKN